MRDDGPNDADPAPEYRPDPRHQQLGELFFDGVEPARFPAHVLRHRNDRAAREVGLASLDDAQWIDHFGRFEPLPDNLPRPLALRYHGHQFRAYNPDLGDGRGFLFAQLRDHEGRLLDLGTKGSGTTPWSRSGDGRLTLKGGVRELLATEMLEALRVDTSRTFSLIETGEALMRGDEPSPTRSAVLTRLSHSHVRIGTFQRLAFHGEGGAIGRLVEYCGEHYALGGGDPVRFLEAVIRRVAATGARWWAAGFVHGVLNTDNINVTGESFDYGPWRFLEAHDPAKVAAYFDQTGLYAFARQPEALSWNLARLAECLLVLDEGIRDKLVDALERFPSIFERELTARTFERLGLKAGGEPAAEAEVVRLFYGAMRTVRHPHEQAFHDLVGGAVPGRIAASPNAEAYASDPWREALAAIRRMEPVDASGALALPGGEPGPAEAMPYDEVEAVWARIAQDDDWSPLTSKLGSIAAKGRREATLARQAERRTQSAPSL